MQPIRMATLACAVLLAGCAAIPGGAGSPADSRPASPSASASASASASLALTPSMEPTADGSIDPFAEAPSEVLAREPLPACGIEIVERTAAGDVRNPDARDCFWTAWQEGRPAEFVTVGLTIEGGRVTEVVRVLAADAVEWFIDWSGDPFGPYDGWVRMECTGIATHPGDGPGILIFEPTGCGPETALGT